MAQITSVTSESLQAQIRTLLPSQQGFGEDLQATNVITPVIDLTAAAQGTTTPEALQQALAFGSQTSYTVVNTTTTIANTPGFYRVYGTILSQNTASAGIVAITDGLATKTLFNVQCQTTNANLIEQLDTIIFLRSGDSVTAQSTNTACRIALTVRQVATVNGALVNPSGFTPQ